MKKLLALILLISILIGCTPASQTAPPPTPQLASTQVATPAPEIDSAQWWHDAIFYEIFVRSFNDSNGDGIGDFNGITQKLDYLQELGINALWLMPIHPSPSYHGYDVLNYYAVNPQYGTMDDFKNLLNEAHARDIKIIIDFVPNHTSSQHPFFCGCEQRSKFRISRLVCLVRHRRRSLASRERWLLLWIFLGRHARSQLPQPGSNGSNV